MTEANAAQWTGEMAMAALVGITRDPDATEDDKAGARQEILVMMGATTGRYDIYDRARARRHLRFVIENMKTPCEPRSDKPFVTVLADARRRARGDRSK